MFNCAFCTYFKYLEHISKYQRTLLCTSGWTGDCNVSECKVITSTLPVISQMTVDHITHYRCVLQVNANSECTETFFVTTKQSSAKISGIFLKKPAVKF